VAKVEYAIHEIIIVLNDTHEQETDLEV